MQLAPNVHQIPLGVVNAYLIVENDRLTLIDAGMDKRARRILKAIRELGHAPTDLKQILLTHTDVDHVRGVETLVAASGAHVHASRMEADALARGEPTRHLKLKGILKWLYDVGQPMMRFGAMQVDGVLEAGQLLPILDGLEVIPSPGHTQEHISFYLRKQRILFAGDSFRSNKTGLMISTGVNTWDEEAAKASAARQKECQPEIVCVGHGPVVFEAMGKFPER